MTRSPPSARPATRMRNKFVTTSLEQRHSIGKLTAERDRLVKDIIGMQQTLGALNTELRVALRERFKPNGLRVVQEVEGRRAEATARFRALQAEALSIKFQLRELQREIEADPSRRERKEERQRTFADRFVEQARLILPGAAFDEIRRAAYAVQETSSIDLDSDSDESAKL